MPFHKFNGNLGGLESCVLFYVYLWGFLPSPADYPPVALSGLVHRLAAASPESERQDPPHALGVGPGAFMAQVPGSGHTGSFQEKGRGRFGWKKWF